jgi:hypothetical protein
VLQHILGGVYLLEFTVMFLSESKIACVFLSKFWGLYAFFYLVVQINYMFLVLFIYY